MLRKPRACIQLSHSKTRRESFLFDDFGGVADVYGPPSDSADDFFTFRELKLRGWSQRMVVTLLGAPDSQALNPHIGSGRPMRLFCRRRVGAAEVGAEFSAAKGKASSRSADAKLRSAEKLSFLVDFSAAVEIHVPRFENRELRRLTEVEFGAAFDHDSHLENELSFVILRSRESEWALDPYYWHQGIRLARKRMRQRVLARIIEIYPALSACALVRARLETGSTETA